MCPCSGKFSGCHNGVSQLFVVGNNISCPVLEYKWKKVLLYTRVVMVENSALAASSHRVILLGTQMNWSDVGQNSLQLLALHFCWVERVP